jgi:hypothetical protein
MAGLTFADGRIGLAAKISGAGQARPVGPPTGQSKKERPSLAQLPLLPPKHSALHNYLQQQTSPTISPTVTHSSSIFVKEDLYHPVQSATAFSYTADRPLRFPVSELHHPLRLTRLLS